MATIHFSYADGGCAFHRCLQPARFCNPDFAPLGHELLVGSLIPANLDRDTVFWTHGLPLPETVPAIAAHKRKGGRFVWGLDDDMPAIPEWSPARPTDMHAMSMWQMAKEMADLIVVSTPALADTFADVGHKVMVAPNLLDLTMYPLWEPDLGQITFTLPVKVLWSGSNTHAGDVAQLVEPLDALVRRFKNHEVQVIWFGAQPPAALLRDHLHKGTLLYQSGEKFANYQGMLNSIRPDIELAPLLDIPFNHSKSALRVFEAWGMQACPVASPVGEYNVVRSGIDGRYAATANEWLDTLSRLITDHEYRLYLARNGRARVESEFNWDRYECRLPWLKALARVFSIATGNECPVPENGEIPSK